MGLKDRIGKLLLDDNSDMGLSGSVKVDENGEVVEVELLENINLTKETALKIAGLNQGVSMIADSIASMPVKMYEKRGNGARKSLDDYRLKLLNVENHANSTAYNMKKNLIVDYLLKGNGYLDINRGPDGVIQSLINIPVSDLMITKSESTNKREEIVRFSYWGLDAESYEVFNLVRNPKDDDITGVGVLEEGSVVLNEARSLDDYSKNIVSNGFNARGVIESEKILSKGSRTSLGDLIRNFFSGSRKSGKVLILDDGMKFKSLSLSPADMNLIQQKNFTLEDIARLLKIPSALIGAPGSSMVYSNVQQTQLNYLQITIDPIVRIFEATLNKYLLSEDEKKQGKYLELDTSTILRTTPAEELKMYIEGVKNSIYTIEEVRSKLNLPEISGLDRPLIMSGMAIIAEDGSIIGPTPGGTPPAEAPAEENQTVEAQNEIEEIEDNTVLELDKEVIQ